MANTIEQSGLFTYSPPELELPPGLLVRLRNFYKRIAGMEVPKSDIWGTIDGLVPDPESTFLIGSTAPLRDSLVGIATQSFSMESWCADAMAAANAWGVVPVFNPFQPVDTHRMCDGMIESIETACHTPINHPGIPGLTSVRIGHRLIPPKLLEAVTTSALLRKHLTTGRRILEIGAGMGFLCYWLRQLIQPKEYHIVDLPKTALIQAFFLSASMSPDEIWLNGEKKNSAHRVFIHGPFPSSDLIPEESLNIAINQDSLPEMTNGEIHRHLEFIRKSLLLGGVFVSENHESDRGGQTRVFCAIQEHMGLEQIQRSPSWTRAGYVDELWEKVNYAC